MPKTRFQDLIFTVIMVVTMVYCMTVYNLALEDGLSDATFLKAILWMWPEVIGAFIAQRYIAGPIVKKIVLSWFIPGVDQPILITVAMAVCTVCFMAPMMTLYVSILHHGLVSDIVTLWLPKLVMNFPFAICIQLFYVGPFVRFVFRNLFKNQLITAAVNVQQEA
ncbi:MAG: hypothetical protein BI182_16640 [Acetobacterium sp. MES1]|uniref:DUF2798 domain-containing protein n=1 Tax=Acetobacterium sp. MES1 TaxID=1899015 RepID=UPI000B9C8271|nr:DUF2798 domain-containing protein [Acetobacterium sp. MES1]OXS25323.1 MAG: hypothetical protein BI182_16640 [Acetobacterium sp. MES1]